METTNNSINNVMMLILMEIAKAKQIQKQIKNIIKKGADGTY